MSSTSNNENKEGEKKPSIVLDLTEQSPSSPPLPDWEFDDEFDGGDETCGRVIVNLHLYLRDQEPGLKILVISRDPGAPIELPAWCRMTSNELTKSSHPYYLITLKPKLKRSI